MSCALLIQGQPIKFVGSCPQRQAYPLSHCRVCTYLVGYRMAGTCPTLATEHVDPFGDRNLLKTSQHIRPNTALFGAKMKVAVLLKVNMYYVLTTPSSPTNASVRIKSCECVQNLLN